MNIGEILQIFKPALFLLPIIIVAVIGFVVYKLIRKNELQILFKQMESSGSFEDKQKILSRYLEKHMGTMLELANGERTCAVCGHKFSTSGGGYECPECKTSLSYESDGANGKFVLERKATQKPKESQYASNFKRLFNLNNTYKPFIEPGYDGGDDGEKIEVTVTIR